MKRIFYNMMIVVTAITLITGMAPITVFAETGYDRGYTGSMPGDGRIYAEGLDVSFWQGSSLDFNNIKSAGYSYVILRCGSTKGKDTCFDTFYTNAKAAGLNVGTYYYSYATTEAAAAQDAANTLSWISGKKFEYPVYFDYEDSSQSSLSSSEAAAISRKYMDTIRNAGYLVGFYSFKSKMDESWVTTSGIRSTYEGWIARYMNSGNHTDMDAAYSTQYGMYQYTDSKYVNGKGPFDANVCYKDYPSIVQRYGFNGYSASQSNYNAVVENISGGAGCVNVSGWAYDRNDTSANLKIHVYIGGAAGDSNAEGNPFTVADKTRTDVNNAYGCGNNHGFDTSIVTSKTGQQPVYVYAVHPTSGDSSLIGNATVNISAPNNPIGVADTIEAKPGAVQVKGWAFDADDTSVSLQINVCVGGAAGAQGAEEHYITANTSRPDVNNVHHCGDNHGYDSVISTQKTGTQEVYVYAVNIHGGTNVLLGHSQVNIAADIEAPVITNAYITNVTQGSYRVCATAEDNAAVYSAKMLTWTRENQSDKKEYNLSKDGNGVYYADVDRADFAVDTNYFYHNQLTFYDYANNNTHTTVNQDYCITSDTGRTVPDGTYRIVTSVDESKALDVYGAKSEDSTNVDIYANLEDSKQTFALSYIGNGFYTVTNTNSEKALDVFGATYLDGTNVCINTYHNSPNQQWMIKPNSDGTYSFIARNNNLALTVQSDNNVKVNTQNGSASQKWKLRRLLNEMTVSLGNLVMYSGQTAAPDVVISEGNNQLVENTDYTVSFEIDEANGSGVATINGIGKYCGTVSRSFAVTVCELGDINGDGNVTISDATLLQKYLAHSRTLTENQLALADVTGDGVINIRDVTKIQRMVAHN